MQVKEEKKGKAKGKKKKYKDAKLKEQLAEDSKEANAKIYHNPHNKVHMRELQNWFPYRFKDRDKELKEKGIDARGIPITEHRAISLTQLRTVKRFAELRCKRWKDLSPPGRSETSGQPLSFSILNLYHFCSWVVLPVTKKDNCAFVECLAEDDQVPTWFISHWWGEPLKEFILCVEKHSEVRCLEDQDNGIQPYYWVCAYANRQHSLASELGSIDPKDSSFFKAMQIASGVLLILNGAGPKAAVPFTRIWCSFEISNALDSYKPLDISTTLEIEKKRAGKDDKFIRAEILTQEPAEQDRKYAIEQAAWMKAKVDRERHFPVIIIQSGLDSRLELADASEPRDRRTILNSLAGRPLLGEVQEQHPNYTRVNNKLHAFFATTCWRQTIDQKQKGMKALLPEALREDTTRENIVFNFSFCKMDNEDIDLLASGLPHSVANLDLDFRHCHQIGNEGLLSLGSRLATLDKIRSLNLNFKNCHIADEGVQGITSNIPKRVESLTLGFYGCKNIGDPGLQSVAECLTSLSSIKELTLDITNITGNEQVTKKGINELAAWWPPSTTEKLVLMSNKKAKGENKERTQEEKMVEDLRTLANNWKFYKSPVAPSGANPQADLLTFRENLNQTPSRRDRALKTKMALAKVTIALNSAQYLHKHKDDHLQERASSPQRKVRIMQHSKGPPSDDSSEDDEEEKDDMMEVATTATGGEELEDDSPEGSDYHEDDHDDDDEEGGGEEDDEELPPWERELPQDEARASFIRMEEQMQIFRRKAVLDVSFHHTKSEKLRGKEAEPPPVREPELFIPPTTSRKGGEVQTLSMSAVRPQSSKIPQPRVQEGLESITEEQVSRTTSRQMEGRKAMFTAHAHEKPLIDESPARDLLDAYVSEVKKKTKTKDKDKAPDLIELTDATELATLMSRPAKRRPSPDSFTLSHIQNLKNASDARQDHVPVNDEEKDNIYAKDKGEAKKKKKEKASSGNYNAELSTGSASSQDPKTAFTKILSDMDSLRAAQKSLRLQTKAQKPAKGSCGPVVSTQSTDTSDSEKPWDQWDGVTNQISEATGWKTSLEDERHDLENLPAAAHGSALPFNIENLRAAQAEVKAARSGAAQKVKQADERAVTYGTVPLPATFQAMDIEALQEAQADQKASEERTVEFPGKLDMATVRTKLTDKKVTKDLAEPRKTSLSMEAIREALAGQKAAKKEQQQQKETKLNKKRPEAYASSSQDEAKADERKPTTLKEAQAGEQQPVSLEEAVGKIKPYRRQERENTSDSSSSIRKVGKVHAEKTQRKLNESSSKRMKDTLGDQNSKAHVAIAETCESMLIDQTGRGRPIRMTDDRSDASIIVSPPSRRRHRHRKYCSLM